MIPIQKAYGNCDAILASMHHGMFWHVWKAAAVIIGTNPGSHLSLKRMTELVALCRRGKHYSNIAVQRLHFHINTDFWLFRFFLGNE